jgi:hypothetical protein
MGRGSQTKWEGLRKDESDVFQDPIPDESTVLPNGARRMVASQQTIWRTFYLDNVIFFSTAPHGKDVKRERGFSLR